MRMSMFDDFEGLLAHSDIGEVLPYLTDLHAGNTVEAIGKLKELVDSENKYAAYVLGSLFMFGKTPRFYIFHKSYEVGEVKRKSLLEIQEELGFQYWVNLLKLKGVEIEEFHLEGLYDLYKVMQGTSEFFANNDISCRPQDDTHPMYRLFSSEHQLRDFLYRQNHFEVYLDVARDALKRFKDSPNAEDMALAVECLKKILSGDIFSRYSQYEIAHGNFEVGKLYLQGNAYFERDMRKAISYLTQSRLDESYVYLLDYYKQFGDKYIASIRKCVGMIRDDQLRLKLYQENNITPPKLVDLTESLNLLVGTKRKVADIKDYGLEGDFVIKLPKIVDEQKAINSDNEIAESFEMLVEDSLNLNDDLGMDPDTDVNFDPDGYDVVDLYDEYGVDSMEVDFEIVE